MTLRSCALVIGGSLGVLAGQDKVREPGVIDVEVVALQGEMVPGSSDAVMGSQVQKLICSANGNFAYQATIGGSVPDDSIWYRSVDGTQALVSKANVPNDRGVARQLALLDCEDSGTVVFQVEANQSRKLCVWKNGQVKVLARTDPMVGSQGSESSSSKRDGSVVSSFWWHFIHASDDAVFFTTGGGPGRWDEIWVSDGNPIRIAESGAALQVLPRGVVLGESIASAMSGADANSAEWTVVRIGLAGPGVPLEAVGVFLLGAKTIELITGPISAGFDASRGWDLGREPLAAVDREGTVVVSAVEGSTGLGKTCLVYGRPGELSMARTKRCPSVIRDLDVLDGHLIVNKRFEGTLEGVKERAEPPREPVAWSLVAYTKTGYQAYTGSLGFLAFDGKALPQAALMVRKGDTKAIILRTGDELVVSREDKRKVESLRVLGLTSEGRAIVAAELGAKPGVRDKTIGVFVCTKPPVDAEKSAKEKGRSGEIAELEAMILGEWEVESEGLNYVFQAEGAGVVKSPAHEVEFSWAIIEAPPDYWLGRHILELSGQAMSAFGIERGADADVLQLNAGANGTVTLRRVRK